jgi:hypothetical protein
MPSIGVTYLDLQVRRHRDHLEAEWKARHVRAGRQLLPELVAGHHPLPAVRGLELHAGRHRVEPEEERDPIAAQRRPRIALIADAVAVVVLLARIELVRAVVARVDEAVAILVVRVGVAARVDGHVAVAAAAIVTAAAAVDVAAAAIAIAIAAGRGRIEPEDLVTASACERG